MPARVALRSPVHIFSTPTASTVPVPAMVARVAMWRAEEPPAHELSTLMIPAWRSPDRLRNVWPRMQPWSTSRPAVALPNTTRLTSSGSTPASARASATTCWAMSPVVRSRLFIGVMAVPTMCAVRSMASFLSSGRHAGRRQGGGQAFELLQRFVGGDVDRHMLGPCIAIGGDYVGHLGGGPGHQVVIERLGRDAVEGGHPPGAPSSAHPGVVVDGDEQDDGRGDLAGLPPDAVDLLGQALESGAVLGGAQEEGHPPVGQRGRPAQGGLRGAADPHGHGCRGGQLAVASGATGLEV